MRRWALSLCAVLVGGCASAPTLPTLVEERHVYEQRALDRYASGELADAVANFRQAVRFAELADDRNALMVDLLNLGAVADESGLGDDAAQAYRRAHSLAQVTGRSDLELQALNGLAQVRYRAGDCAQASQLYATLLSHPAATGDNRGRIMALNGLALCAMQEERLEAAEDYLTQAASLGERPATALNRATLALKRDRAEEAERAARRALELDRSAGYVPGIANDLELLGEALRRQGRADEAHLSLTQALALYRQLQNADAVQRVQRRLNP